MRLKTILKYNVATAWRALLLFYCIYMAATIGSVIMGGVVTLSLSGTGAEEGQSWSISMISFAVFMLIFSLVGSQNETKFLITRSVSRKEIFVASAIFLIPMAAVLGALQIISIYADNLVRVTMGFLRQGLALDVQSMQAPDMKNMFVFHSVSSAMLLGIGAVGYLLGSLLQRWKMATIIVMGAVSILGIGLIMSAGSVVTEIVKALEFMFVDPTTGLWIALKHTVLAVILLGLAYPVMRKVAAVRQ